MIRIRVLWVRVEQSVVCILTSEIVGPSYGAIRDMQGIKPTGGTGEINQLPRRVQCRTPHAATVLSLILRVSESVGL